MSIVPAEETFLAVFIDVNDVVSEGVEKFTGAFDPDHWHSSAFLARL